MSSEKKGPRSIRKADTTFSLHDPKFFHEEPTLIRAVGADAIRRKVAYLRQLNSEQIAMVRINGIRLPGAKLSNIILRYSLINDSDFSGAVLTKADLEGSWLLRSKLPN